MEAPLPGRLLIQRCPPPRLGRTLDENSRPWMSSFRDGVLGLGRRQQVQNYQGDDSIGAQQCTVAASMRYNWLGGPGGIPIVGGKRFNLK